MDTSDKPKKNRKRYRKLIPFQLDVNQREGQEIAAKIRELKHNRAFSKTVRDGIRLVYDLRNGRTEVLQELFPWVLEHIEISTVTIQPNPTQSFPDDILRQQLERLESLIMEQSNNSHSPVGAESNLREHTHEKSPRKSSEAGIDFEIKQAINDKDNNTNWNFAIASALLADGNCDTLAPEIIAYGLRTGRILESQVSVPPPQKKTPTPSKADGNPKKMQGADIDITPPSDIEDLDFAWGDS